MSSASKEMLNLKTHTWHLMKSIECYEPSTLPFSFDVEKNEIKNQNYLKKFSADVTVQNNHSFWYRLETLRECVLFQISPIKFCIKNKEILVTLTISTFARTFVGKRDLLLAEGQQLCQSQPFVLTLYSLELRPTPRSLFANWVFKEILKMINNFLQRNLQFYFYLLIQEFVEKLFQSVSRRKR